MAIPRLLLGAAMLLSVHSLTALDLSLNAWEGTLGTVVEGRVLDIDSGELVRRIDGGGTARVTWQFRLGESESTIIRFARRDSLGEGYIIYGSSSDESTGPFDAVGLVPALSFLPRVNLEELGVWEPDEVLEGRILLDYELNSPSLSLLAFLPGRRERSKWIEIPHAEAEHQ